MSAQHVAYLADGDLRVRIRGTRGEDGFDDALAPGECTWADGPLRADGPRVVVFPLNGALAASAYPIGQQARTCAANSQCTMEFCAQEAGGELRAADGFIHVTFGGSDTAHMERSVRLRGVWIRRRDPAAGHRC